MTKPAAAPKNFEQAMEELEHIVSTMETGKLPLDDMLCAYKRGAELARFCRDKLAAAQAEIKKLEKDRLVAFDDDGAD